ncbi:ATP-binding protein [Streptomyces agglomeratus]|uniref:ATP-binding protein n=1 Tax=Streptomyces agglomeratus TaxID=285458 RepID=UPI00114C9F0B|nr:ATP-binding protein [Streptomyces agglomeratus]
MSESMERHIDLADTSDAPGQARETATDFLADAERIRGEPTSPDTISAVLIVVSELVTNAIRHAPGCARCG